MCQRPRATEAILERRANLVVASRQVSQLQWNHAWRLGAIKLDTTSTIVRVRFGHDLEHPVGRIRRDSVTTSSILLAASGAMRTRISTFAGAIDSRGDTAIASGSLALVDNVAQSNRALVRENTRMHC